MIARYATITAMLVAGAIPLRGRAVEVPEDLRPPNATEDAGRDVRLRSDAVSQSSSGLVVEVGKDGEKVTGRIAWAWGAYGFDVGLTGADIAKGRSGLFGTAATGKGGELALGATWSTFNLDRYRSVLDQLESLCAEQRRVDEARFEKALGEDQPYGAAAAEFEQARAEAQKAQVRLQEVAARPRPERAPAEHDDLAAAREECEDARAKLEDYLSKTTAGTGLLERATRIVLLRTKWQDRARAVRRLELATEMTDLTDKVVAETPFLAMDAATTRNDLAAARLERAQTRLASERARVAAAKRRPCDTIDDLDPEARANIVVPRPVNLVTALRARVAYQSTDYFDAGLGKFATDSAYPFSASAGVGVYVVPTALVGVSAGLMRARGADDPTQVCVAGASGLGGQPATYECRQVALTTPAWATVPTLRLELRQYLSSFVRGLSWNPAITFKRSIGSGERFDLAVGEWQAELPFFMELPAGERRTLALGVSLFHSQSWGVTPRRETNGATVFLGSGFGLGMR